MQSLVCYTTKISLLLAFSREINCSLVVINISGYLKYKFKDLWFVYFNG